MLRVGPTYRLLGARSRGTEQLNNRPYQCPTRRSLTPSHSPRASARKEIAGADTGVCGAITISMCTSKYIDILAGNDVCGVPSFSGSQYRPTQPNQTLFLTLITVPTRPTPTNKQRFPRPKSASMAPDLGKIRFFLVFCGTKEI